MILAVGNSSSLEVEAYRQVVESLKRRGENAALFRQDRCLAGETLSFEIHNGVAAFTVVIDGVRYTVDDFSAIWYLKPHLPIELLTFEPADQRQLLHRQFLEMRQALWSIFHNKRWLDDPHAIARTENKLYQLHIAARVGLRIPDTLITSDPDQVRDFYAAHGGNIVVKLLAVSPLIGRVVYTNRVTPEHLEKIDSVKLSPSIFQALVKKAYELRITIVGDQIFAAKIWSQEDTATALDWRRKPALNDFNVRMEPAVLPERIAEDLKALLRALGLRFGCIDMIVTPEQEHLFLEVNPNGQWYFVQLRTGQQIAEAIAGLLVGK